MTNENEVLPKPHQEAEVVKPVRKARKLQPKPSREGKPPYNNPWARKTEAQRAEWKANMLAATAGKQGRPKGLPDGIGAKAFAVHKLTIEAETKIIMERLMKDNDLKPGDDDFAIEALSTAVTIMRLEGETRCKLNAARLVLEYTKSKPSTKSEVTMNHAEAFLEQILADEAKK